MLLKYLWVAGRGTGFAWLPLPGGMPRVARWQPWTRTWRLQLQPRLARASLTQADLWRIWELCLFLLVFYFHSQFSGGPGDSFLSPQLREQLGNGRGVMFEGWLLPPKAELQSHTYRRSFPLAGSPHRATTGWLLQPTRCRVFFRLCQVAALEVEYLELTVVPIGDASVTHGS